MAMIDARQLENGHVIKADLCIVGAGPAGIALAKEFAQSRLRVALIESGGLDFDADTWSLAQGKAVGIPYPVQGSRLRYFGGTSNHWDGNVRPLDPLDFEKRSWVPYSGWPFGSKELAAYYERAKVFMGLPDQAFDIAYWEKQMAAQRWPTQASELTSKIFHTLRGPHLRFGKASRDALDQAANIETYLFANVIEIETNEAVTAVRGLKLRTLDGKEFRAHGRYYVLATGGIENARLLLLSSSRMKTGVGNHHDLVGRFFMEHLTFPDFAKFFPSDPHLKLDFYKPASFNRAWGETWGILSLSEDGFRKEQLPNIRFQVATVINRFNEGMQREGMRSLQTLRQSLDKGLPDEFERHLANVIADIDSVANSAYFFLRHHPNYPLVYVHIVSIQEQVPNPQSRIFLGDDIDRLGQRRIVMDWRITDVDRATVRRGADILGRALGVAGLGRLQDNLDREELQAGFPKPHFHHMGTTRMHGDPKQGVVDADCRVHGVANLYVAGSSVFPTVGNVNPTFTLVALAIRLADHLKKQSNI